MADVTYWFDGYAAVQWTDQAFAIDNILTTFAFTSSDGLYIPFNENTCPGTDLGTISKVEIRAYVKGDGDDKLIITPLFSAGALSGDDHETTPPTSVAWGPYVDVTNDTNHPTWSWAEVVLLKCNAKYIKTAKANAMPLAKVELRVTYTPSGGYYHGLKVEGEDELALCDVGTHPLRIRKGGTTYGIELVPTDDPNASAVRIQTSSGTKAIRRYT